MKRSILFVTACVVMAVVYYAGAQQNQQPGSLKQAWESAVTEKGVLIFPDKDNPYFSYNVNQRISPNAQIVHVGNDYVIIQRNHSISSYYQITIPFSQIHIRYER